MDLIIQSFVEDWNAFISYAPRLLAALIILLLTYFIGRAMSKFVVVVLRRTSSSKIHEPFFRISTILICLFFGLIISLNVLGLERMAVSLLAGGGITAVVLGFAFREIGENFLAGFFLAFTRPFNKGDFIKTEDIQGEVKEIEIRYTHLRTSDGRDVYVPSSQLFNKPVTNFTKDKLRRFSFTVGIDYANDARAACELLEKGIYEIDLVLKDPKPQAYILSLAPQYVEIEVFFWLDILNKSINTIEIRTMVMDMCRKTLLNEGFTVSSETTTNIALKNNDSKS